MEGAEPTGLTLDIAVSNPTFVKIWPNLSDFDIPDLINFLSQARKRDRAAFRFRCEVRSRYINQYPGAFLNLSFLIGQNHRPMRTRHLKPSQSVRIGRDYCYISHEDSSHKRSFFGCFSTKLGESCDHPRIIITTYAF